MPVVDIPITRDTKLALASPTTNYGSDASSTGLESNNFSEGAKHVSLLAADDLSAIPAGATINSVELRMVCTDRAGSDREYHLYQLLTAWTEDGATWNTKDGTAAWGTAGAQNTSSDRSSTSLSSWTSVDPGTAVWPTSAGFVSLMSGWKAGTTTNNGIVVQRPDLGAGTIGGYAAFRSSEDSTAGNRPFFRVDYTAAASNPVLSSPTVVSTGNGIATVRVTTDTAPSGSSTLAVRTRAVGATPWTAAEVLAAPTATITSGASGARDFNLTGLTNGTALAADFAQTGPSNVVSTGSFTPSTVPGAPTIGTAVAGNAQATVNGTAPGSTGGSAITGYRSTATPGGSTVTGASLPITHTGLANGTAYTFTLAAQNANGYGPESAASNSVTPSAGGDTTAPTLTSPSGTGGTLTCSGSVSTNEANGSLYAVVTASATAPTALQVRNGQDHTGAAALRAVGPQTVTATGTQSIASGAVTAGSRFFHFMHEDAAGNRSAVVSSGAFTVSAGSPPPPPPPPPSGHDVGPIFNNTYSAPLEGTTVHYSWYANGRIGSLTGITPTEGTGVVGSDGMLAIAPSGAGCVFVAKRNAGATTDDVFYQAFAS